MSKPAWLWAVPVFAKTNGDLHLQIRATCYLLQLSKIVVGILFRYFFNIF